MSVTDSKIVDALQEKLNDYMDYVISKQYEELYNPEAYDKIAIKIVAKIPFSNEGTYLNDSSNMVVCDFSLPLSDHGFDVECAKNKEKLHPAILPVISQQKNPVSHQISHEGDFYVRNT